MKQKHYPLVTFLAAIALTVMPAGLLLLASRAGSAIDDPFADDASQEFVPPQEFTGQTGPGPTEVTDVVEQALSPDADLTTAIVARSSAAQLSTDRNSLHEIGSPDHDAVQTPIDALTVDREVSPPPSMSALRPSQTETTVPQVTPTDMRADAAPQAVSSVEDVILMPAISPPAATSYEATGHPVLDERRSAGMPASSVVEAAAPDADHAAGSASSPILASMSGAGSSAGSPETPASMSDQNARPTPADTVKPRRQRRGDSRQQGASPAVDSAAEKAMVAMPAGVTPSPEAVLPQAQLEEVVLQRPLETRRVGRVEDVVAVTRATGWPIALVRSDIPGDEWWVQQMIGINGTTFAARVNFGNADSITGSGYRMIFVFLDSPEEVRRFRIAKQFKEIPEGVRRSREFQFIRE